MIKSSKETIRSYDFKTDKLCVIVSIAQDRPSFGTILNEDESCKQRMMMNVFQKKTRMN